MADAQEKVKCATKPRKRKRFSQNGTAKESRVAIGLAFDKWRALKATMGLKSDAAVAQFLLDQMKRMPSLPASSGARGEKMKFSVSELQMLIKQEVCSAVTKNETKLQGLIDTIQQMDGGVDYESTIQTLEARINVITKRAEAALSYMTQNKSPLPSGVNLDTIRSPSENEAANTKSLTDNTSFVRIDRSGEPFQIMETTKKVLKQMLDSKAAVKAAIADFREERPPPVLAPYGSPDCKQRVSIIKKEPEDLQEMKYNVEEPKAKRIKVEHELPGGSSSPKHTDPKQPKLSYPPLPSISNPHILDKEAASYNIPKRPEVQLALIRNPAGLSVLWKVEDDPRAPPMDKYSVYMTMEEVKGSGVFPKWSSLGQVVASPLPICVMISKYKPGHKVCVAVVGKDKFGRYGPYSKVITAAIPDEDVMRETKTSSCDSSGINHF